MGTRTRIEAALHNATQKARIRGHARPVGPVPPLPPVCDSCREPRSLCLDHCHVTGIIRGWLCQHCNRALGALRDSALKLKALATYVERAYERRS